MNHEDELWRERYWECFRTGKPGFAAIWLEMVPSLGFFGSPFSFVKCQRTTQWLHRGPSYN